VGGCTDLRTHEADVAKRTVIEVAQCLLASAAAKLAPDRLDH
jgi:hypothetical protein